MKSSISLAGEINELLSSRLEIRRFSLSELVEKIQKEAYNEAINDAAKNAEANVVYEKYSSNDPIAEIDDESILKLIKP